MGNTLAQRIACRRRAFTLVEIVTSLAISSILLLALVSAVLLASKALPESAAAVDSREATAVALDVMMSELSVAKNVTVAGATDVRFTVADRTGDLADDTIEYQWSGMAGDPLQRNFNDSGWTIVSPPLKAFALVYGSRNVSGNDSLARVNAAATTSDTSARIDAGIQALNKPGVPGP